MNQHDPPPPTLESVYFCGRRSGLQPILTTLWTLGFFSALIGIPGYLLTLPALKNIAKLADEHAGVLALIVLGLFAAMILYLVWMWSEWRNIKYTLTSRTITFEYGTFSRTIKSIELWRIRQMVYHGGVLESLLGIGRIHVESKELTGTFSKIGPIFRAHQIYKSLDGARQVAIRERGVMAVES